LAPYLKNTGRFAITAFLGQPLHPEVSYCYHAAIAKAVHLPLILFQLQPALGDALFTTKILHRLIPFLAWLRIKKHLSIYLIT
jgi:hypothetical protein